MHFSQNCDSFLILFPHPSSLLSSHIGRCSMKLKEGVVGSYAFAPSISFRKFWVLAGVYLVANEISQESANWLCFIVLCSRTTGSQLQDRMDAHAVTVEMTARSRLLFIFPQRWGSLGIISQEWHSRHSWGATPHCAELTVQNCLMCYVPDLHSTNSSVISQNPEHSYVIPNVPWLGGVSDWLGNESTQHMFIIPKELMSYMNYIKHWT